MIVAPARVQLVSPRASPCGTPGLVPTMPSWPPVGGTGSAAVNRSHAKKLQSQMNVFWLTVASGPQTRTKT